LVLEILNWISNGQMSAVKSWSWSLYSDASESWKSRQERTSA